MGKQKKVGFATKLLSNHNYLNEVSVEGKATHKFNFTFGFYDQYAAQIIRSGNCITLLSNDITINKDTFWNTNYFEDFAKYVFWTFNESFLLTLIDTIHTLNLSVLKRCEELLQENFTPYDDKLEEQADEELQWCLVKNDNLKKDSKFDKMYSLDIANRVAIIKALKEKNCSTEIPEKVLLPSNQENIPTETNTTSFLDTIKSFNNPRGALEFIIAKTEQANFEFNLFSKVDKLPNGKILMV